MKKIINHTLFLAGMILFFTQATFAQTYDRITDTSGFELLGSTYVWVQQQNGATKGTGFTCTNTGPYLIGSNVANNSYTYDFYSPKPEIVRLQIENVDSGETVSIFINGVLYPVSVSEISSLACSTSLDVIESDNGIITRTVNSAAPSYGQVDIKPGYAIDSIRVTKDGLVAGGVGYSIFIAHDTIIEPAKPFTDTIKCAGDSLYLEYDASTAFSSINTFTAQLSDANGSFTTPVNIGYILADSAATIACKIPANTAAGAGYRIRIVASSPARISLPYEKALLIGNTYPANVTVSNNGPVCSNVNLALTGGSTSPGVTYSWTGPSFNSTQQNPSVGGAQSGYYVLTVTLNGCSKKDSTQSTVKPTPNVSAASNSPVCFGGIINLTATSVTSGVTYAWTGPGGYTSTIQNPVITGASAAHNGAYLATASLNGCTSSPSTTTVTALAGPTINAYPSPKDVVCEGTTVTFVTIASNAGTTPKYQWYKNGSPIPNATSKTYATSNVANGDIYKCELIPSGASSCGSSIYTINIPMTVLAIAPLSGEVQASNSNPWPGLHVVFTAKAVNAGGNPKYQWKLNNVAIAGATDSTWASTTLNDKDNVCVDITSRYQCSAPSKTDACQKVNITTGINTTERSLVKAYPNPVTDQLNIEGITKGTIMQLTNVLGQTVISRLADDENTMLGMRSLPAGTYILHLTNEKMNDMHIKVIKE